MLHIRKYLHKVLLRTTTDSSMVLKLLEVNDMGIIDRKRTIETEVDPFDKYQNYERGELPNTRNRRKSVGNFKRRESVASASEDDYDSYDNPMTESSLKKRTSIIGTPQRKASIRSDSLDITSKTHTRKLSISNTNDPGSSNHGQEVPTPKRANPNRRSSLFKSAIGDITETSNTNLHEVKKDPINESPQSQDATSAPRRKSMLPQDTNPNPATKKTNTNDQTAEGTPMKFNWADDLGQESTTSKSDASPQISVSSRGYVPRTVTTRNSSVAMSNSRKQSAAVFGLRGRKQPKEKSSEPGLESKSNLKGSRVNLAGSKSNLRGSKSNLMGSKGNLHGSKSNLSGSKGNLSRRSRDDLAEVCSWDNHNHIHIPFLY
jgi:hypothetical protein